MVVGKGDVVADGDDGAEDEEKARLVKLRVDVWGQLSLDCAHASVTLTACSRR